MKKLWLLMGLFFVTGCGLELKLTHDLLTDDEEKGTPVRPLEDAVPGHAELPSPSTVLEKMREKPASDPTWNPISSVGFYSRGKLYGYWEVLPSDLWDVRESSQKKKRNFASMYAWEPMTTGMKAYYNREHQATMIQIWDIGGNFGGRISGHVSHQMGLDFDIEYPYEALWKVKSPETIDYEQTFSLMYSLVETGKIQRMFTSVGIKKKICKVAAARGWDKGTTYETLRAIRPWPGHENHIHFRFRCPAKDVFCVPQTEVPAGTGC